ncbi:MAG: TrkH family potassium uptake protein [Bacillota bacterium]|nr:TrkH family potassium uptake protein [Bacillota bacterium]
MNYKLMLRTLGRTLQLEGLCLFLPLGVSLFYREDPRPFLYTILLVLLLGTGLSRLRSKPDFYSREGYAVVGLIWLALGLFGALPFWFSGYFTGYVDCLFETVSGFTTTGASILTDIEALPRGILFWRSFSSWIGGMGVLIFTLAFLPKVGGRTQVLVQAESPGPVSSKLVPKTAQSSQILYLIYIALTALEILCLSLAGMPLYDAAVTTFATVCTGGFSVMNASIAAYGLPACEIIITVFMLLCSLNFAAFFLVLTGRARQALRSDELRFFLIAVLLAVAIIFWNVRPLYDTLGETLRIVCFQVATIVSTAGFSTADFALWPTLSQLVLVLLMFLGGCAGSTAGGLKCSRVLLMLRGGLRTLRRLSHPREVKVVKLDGKAVDEGTLSTVFVFFSLYCLTLGATAALVALDGESLTTSFTAALACLSNVGPGLDAVGPTGNFAAFSPLSKVGLTLSMLIGRLEIFPILILMLPSTWKRN